MEIDIVWKYVHQLNDDTIRLIDKLVRLDVTDKASIEATVKSVDSWHGR